MAKLYVLLFCLELQVFCHCQQRSEDWLSEGLEKVLAPLLKNICYNSFIYAFSAIVEARITFNSFTSGFLGKILTQDRSWQVT